MPDTLSALITVVTDDSSDPAIREQALTQLAATHQPQAFAAIAAALAAADPALRRAAATILINTDEQTATWATTDPAAMTALIAALAGPEDKVGRAAALVLRRSTTPAAHTALAQHLHSADPPTKTRIIWTQMHAPIDDDLVGDIAVALTDPDAAVRQAARDAFSGRLPAHLTHAVLLVAAAVPQEQAWQAVRALATTATSQPSAADALITALGHTDARVRALAASALKAADAAPVTTALSQATRDPDSDVRAAALESLTRRHQPAALEAFIVALDDPEATIRNSAAQALSPLIFRDNAELFTRAVEALADTAHHNHDAAIRLMAIQTLGAVLHSESPATWYTAALCGVLDAVADIDPSVRLAAVQALDGATRWSAVVALLSAFDDPDTEITCAAACGLRSAAAGPVTDKLLTATRHSAPQVRIAALTALTSSRADQAVQDRAIEALTDTDSGVRLAAVPILRSDNPTTVSAILGVLDHDPSTDVRRAAADALAEATDPRVLAALSTALQHGEPILAAAAAEALATSPIPQSTDLLFAALSDADPAVRNLAANALDRRRSPEVNTYLTALLADPAPQIRLLALVHLARRGAHEALPAINALVEDPDPRVSSLAQQIPTYFGGGYVLIQAPDGRFQIERPLAGPQSGAVFGLPGRTMPASRGPAEDKVTVAEDNETVKGPAEPRRLVARVFDEHDQPVKKSVLPPNRTLQLAVRIAIPEEDDIACDEVLTVPAISGPTLPLEVEVRGEALNGQQPTTQTIALQIAKVSMPSSRALFSFTTPDCGGLVSIEIRLSYQGKPLQAATFVSPVRNKALTGEGPTLTAFALSGPDEPMHGMRRVDVAFDATGAELTCKGREARMLITDVREMLDIIEQEVSKVLGVPGAPDFFTDKPDDDRDPLKLLISLACHGHELAGKLERFDIGQTGSIDVLVTEDTPVLPLELVYAGADAPDKDAQLCGHLGTGDAALPPPPLGQPCDKVSAKCVCPYAFWGLYRSISRTVRWTPQQPPTPQQTLTMSLSPVLYAASVIADEGSSPPLPSVSVYQDATQLFNNKVTQVTDWQHWAKAIAEQKPNLLVVLGHTELEPGSIDLYIGANDALDQAHITEHDLSAEPSRHPLVLLIACATAALGHPFGSLPGKFTREGAGTVVGTLSKIIGPHGAAAAKALLKALHDQAGTDDTIGDAVLNARRALIAEQRPIGLVLVSHGEINTRLTL